METFSALLALYAGNSPVTGGFPLQRPVTRSFDVFFDLRLNKRLSKQSRHRWFETPPRSLWRHCNVWPKFIQRTSVSFRSQQYKGQSQCQILRIFVKPENYPVPANKHTRLTFHRTYKKISFQVMSYTKNIYHPWPPVYVLTGMILSLHPTIERRCYKVTPSLIGWVQTYNQPCIN